MTKKTSEQKVVVMGKVPRQTRAVAVKQEFSIENLFITAVERGTSVKTMERLMAIRRELKAEQAKEAFDAAMAKFQSECPIIKKSREGGRTKSGVVAYHYAPLEVIISQTRGLISDNGFSYSTQTKTLKASVKATCIVKHILGHSEPSSVEVPLGTGTPIMSAPQITAAALTFAKRHAFVNAFGIMTGDTDNDCPQTNMPNKPQEKPLSVKETQDLIIKAINNAKNSAVVIDVDMQTQASERLSKTFKTKVNKLANDKVNQLDNGK